MTREDAILCLKGIKNYGRDTFTSKSQGDWQESLDMAIKALEQESCEDAISRKEIISHLEFCLANTHDYKSALQKTLEKVRNTRNVQPKQKKRTLNT